MANFDPAGQHIYLDWSENNETGFNQVVSVKTTSLNISKFKFFESKW